MRKMHEILILWHVFDDFLLFFVLTPGLNSGTGRAVYPCNSYSKNLMPQLARDGCQ